MTSRDPEHIYRHNMWSGYGQTSHHAGGGPIAGPGHRDPDHIYRAGFWDSYAMHGKAGAGGAGGGGRRRKKKAKAHVRYSRRALPALAMRDAWGHRGQAGGQG